MPYLLPSVSVSTTTNAPDGRSTRWDEHRAQRRRELIDAALRAIRQHGAGVGMEDIAAMAGTSKTVVYRHFTDRAGLYAAVAERVESLIVRDLGAALATTEPTTSSREEGESGRAILAAAIDSYLRLVERDPEVYRFIVTAPMIDAVATGGGRSDVRGVMSHVAGEIANVLHSSLTDAADDKNTARIWGVAVVGMVQAAADDWIRPGGSSRGVPRDELVDKLTRLTWAGLSASWPS